MSKLGSQAIGCNVSSCHYFENNECTLSNIQVGASNNASSGIAEEETLCMSYKRRDVQKEDRDEHIKRFGLQN
ncbi:MAG: DUF1540 domain-containing protein [Syntrophomonas sp.]|nr:DUF1540 domain-containing protein [Syntrophomonas sp.]